MKISAHYRTITSVIISGSGRRLVVVSDFSMSAPLPRNFWTITCIRAITAQFLSHYIRCAPLLRNFWTISGTSPADVCVTCLSVTSTSQSISSIRWRQILILPNGSRYDGIVAELPEVSRVKRATMMIDRQEFNGSAACKP